MTAKDSKKKSQQNKALYIFLTTFFITLIVTIYIATAFTPNIDVDVNTTSNETTSQNEKKDIDSRLKDLQEDEYTINQQQNETESSSEIIEHLKKMKEEAIAKQLKKDELELEDEIIEENPSPKTNNAQSAPSAPKPELASPTYTRQNLNQPHAPTKMAKVYVGRYSTFDDALAIQNKLIIEGLASAPFIKNLGGYYVVQIGSYANHQTAQNIAENIIENGYSARMVLE